MITADQAEQYAEKAELSKMEESAFSFIEKYIDDQIKNNIEKGIEVFIPRKDIIGVLSEAKIPERRKNIIIKQIIKLYEINNWSTEYNIDRDDYIFKHIKYNI